MLSRLFLGGAIVLFTTEHPHLVAFAAIYYLFSQFIEEEEKVMLKDFVSKGIIWLTQINILSRSKGLKMKEGREIISNVTDSLFRNLEPEQLKEINNNEDFQDKLSLFAVQYFLNLNKPAVEDEWEKWAYPLNEDDSIDDYDKEFINLLAPNFNWSQNYTRKIHRELSKTMKSKFRNSDGSIKDELGNNAVLSVLQSLEMSRGDIPDVEIYTSEIGEFVMNYVIKNSTKPEFTRFLDELLQEEQKLILNIK